LVGGYDSIIAEAARKYGVPEANIRAVMRVESSGDPRATSGKGASGLMQVMPATYDELARKHGLGADRYDPRNNIMAGTAYLREMNDRYGGDWTKTYQAYNAGPGRVESGARLPAETRAYVPKVNANLGGNVAGYRTGYTGPGATYAPDPQFTAMLDNIRRNGPPQDRRPPGTYADAATPESEAEFRGLLEMEFPPERNQANGLGGLLNYGQTPTQPPRPGDPVGGPAGTSVPARIDDLMSRLARPVDRGPQMTPGQYQLSGATNAVTELAGIRNRKVGFGELLGALGGGLVRGTNAADQAQRQQRADEFGELKNMASVQGMQRSEATAQRQLQAANAYAAQIEKVNPGLAAALRDNPALMDEIAKAQAQQQFAKDDTTPLVRNAIAAGLKPGTPEFNKFVQDNAGSGTRINLNTAENHAGKGLADIRVEQYKSLRDRGQNAGKMLDKLGQLETVLDEIGTTGPGTPALSRVIGWAQQAGIPTADITKLYEDYTGQNMADPAKVDLAQKLIQDFVTQSIKTLGANPTDTDLRTLQQANPSITNQREANKYIIQNTLRPQYEYDRDLWNDVRGLDGKDQTLDTLETRVADFERRKREEKEAAKRKDSPKPSPTQAPDAAQITQQFPGARQMKDGRWAAPDPSSKTGWRLIVPQ
jgi:hypothetical protein